MKIDYRNLIITLITNKRDYWNTKKEAANYIGFPGKASEVAAFDLALRRQGWSHQKGHSKRNGAKRDALYCVSSRPRFSRFAVFLPVPFLPTDFPWPAFFGLLLCTCRNVYMHCKCSSHPPDMSSPCYLIISMNLSAHI